VKSRGEVVDNFDFEGEKLWIRNSFAPELV
jgi:hypothetical protein